MMRTAHLDLTVDGIVWLRCLPTARLLDGLGCGLIGCPIWPTGLLGEEPNWFWSEVEQLRIWWDEDVRISEEEGRDELARATSEYYADCISR